MKPTAFAACLLAFSTLACGGSGGDETPAPADLVIEDITVGTGATVVSGDRVTVHYRGTFLDGRQFDSSYNSNQPFPFTVGAGSVIRGWDQGLVGMRVGGKRRLTIPPHLAYGSAGAGGVIPPNATLRFEIELLSIAGK